MKNAVATLTTLGLLAFFALAPPKLAAHGDATLESSAASVRVGEALALSGSLFVPGEAHRLVLRGTMSEYELGEVTAGSDSTFTRRLSIPADVRPGQYRLVAIAPDGDEVATLDLPVLAAERSSGSGAAAATGDETGSPAGTEARADEIEIQRSRAGLEWGVIGLVIGLAGGLGLGLIRRG